MVVVTLTKDWSPELGLDLQGGVSAVLQPTNEVPDQALDDAMEIIRYRVDALGVAEPEIVRQGNAIVVNLPGVTDRERALEVIGRTAELRFRPVLDQQQYITAAQLEAVPSTTTTVPGATTTTAVVDPAAATTTTVGEGAETTTTEGALAPAGLAEGEFAAALPTQDATTTTHRRRRDPTTVSTTTTVPAVGEPTDAQALDGCALLGGITPPDQDLPEATVVLPGKDDAAAEDEGGEPETCYQLGPVPTDGEHSLTGRIVSDPEAQINQRRVGCLPRDQGRRPALFNQIASQCYNRGAIVPDRSARHRARRRGAVGSVDQRADVLRRRPADLRQLHARARPRTSRWCSDSARSLSSSRPRPSRRCRPPSARTRSAPVCSPASSASPSSPSTCCCTTAPSAWSCCWASPSGRPSTSRSSRGSAHTQGLALVPGRGHRHRRVGRRHRRLLRRLLRAAQGRDPVGQDDPIVGRPRVPSGLPHDPRRRHLELHRRRPALHAHRRSRPRLRLLPRPLDDPRRGRRRTSSPGRS